MTVLKSAAVSLDRQDFLAKYFASVYGDRGTERLSAAARARAEFFRERAGAGKRILDVGCGSGTVTRFVTESNEVTGIDLDNAALENYSRRYGIKPVWGNFETELPFETGRFDVVILCETMEHLAYPEVVLREVRRVLVPDGVFLGSVPNAYRLRTRFDFLRGRPLDRDPSHLRHFSLTSLTSLLSHGFAVEEIVSIRGRWAWLSPALFAHGFAWRCRRLN
jgi:SAM-dependent methyltransferase